MGVIANKEENLVTVMEVIMRLWISRTSSKKIRILEFQPEKKYWKESVWPPASFFYSYRFCCSHTTHRTQSTSIPRTNPPIIPSNSLYNLSAPPIILYYFSVWILCVQHGFSKNNALHHHQCLYTGFIEWKMMCVPECCSNTTVSTRFQEFIIIIL